MDKEKRELPEIILTVDQSRDSNEAIRLLKLSGLKFRMDYVEGDFSVPSMEFDAPNSYEVYKHLRDVGSIEWIMKGLAPEAFARYLNGEKPKDE